MKMFAEAKWQDKAIRINVVNPFDGAVIDTIPQATGDDVERALATLQRGAELMRQLPAIERQRILQRSAALVEQRSEELANTISREEGKILPEARVEAVRAAEVLEISAGEAVRLAGEMIPLDAAAHGAGKMGFTLRVPCGIVAAITPFNFPLNLVTHKVGPAIAGGNAVLIKPATDTPLSALKLTEILLEAGMPPEAIACLTGRGGELGAAICGDDRVRKISFTGSHEVGEIICQQAGMKRVTMELGSNSPVIIMDDADVGAAAQAVAAAGYSNAGQVCISAQRILTSRRVHSRFLDALQPLVESLTVGDQLDERTRVGPMVRQRDAERVDRWVREAVESGAQLLTGGERNGALYQPAILNDVSPDQKVSADELFGPAVAVTQFDDIEVAIQLANSTRYGLSASIFTQDVDRAFRFAQQVDSGNIHVNWSTQWRADHMPYGGLKHSGTGKEGPKYALREMTEEKMVVLHLKPPAR